VALPVKIAKGLGLMEWWSIAKYQISSTKLQINLKFQYSMTKTRNRFRILKLGTRPQGGESKRSADNFGHCDLFDICDLRFGIYDTPTDSRMWERPLKPLWGWLRAPPWILYCMIDSASKWVVSGSMMELISPSRTCSSLYSVRLIRCSVTRFWGKL
jgi:hypothetical protein